MKPKPKNPDKLAEEVTEEARREIAKGNSQTWEEFEEDEAVEEFITEVKELKPPYSSPEARGDVVKEYGEKVAKLNEIEYSAGYTTAIHQLSNRRIIKDLIRRAFEAGREFERKKLKKEMRV